MARVVMLHELGGPEVLRIEERDVGAPGEGEGKKEEYHQHFCGKQGSRSPEFPDSSRNSFKHDC